MKTHLLTLLSFAALAMAISCNEKVSSQVDDAASGGTTGTTTGGSTTGGTSGTTGGGAPSTPPVPPAVGTFKVSLESNPLAGFKIHRTGFAFDSLLGTYPSRKESPCEVTGSVGTPLSNALYDAEAAANHDDKQFDISCFIEVEELSLYLNDLKIKVEASENTCEAVEFEPYAYWSYPAGNSSGYYKTIGCPSGATTAPNAVTDHDMDCGNFRYTNSAYADVFPGNNIATPSSDAELCRYNYTLYSGPNCDEGIIRIRQYNYINDPAAPGTIIADPVRPWSNRTVQCGGKAYNCINGPRRKLGGVFTARTRAEIAAPVRDVAFARSYTLPAMIGSTAGSNMTYVNYRRDLANPNTEYTSSFYDSNPSAPVPHTFLYKTSFDPANYGMNTHDLTFDPNLMDFYSKNLKMDGRTNYISSTAIATVTDADYYRTTQYSPEPFMGVNGEEVKPFYTFICKDNADEPRARIRVVVREWDRKFDDPSTSSQFDYLSDIFLDDFAFNDNYGQDSYADDYNDYPDWEDYLFMTRTAGSYVMPVFPGTPGTQYAPAAGFFNSSNFNYDLYNGN